MTNSPIGLSIEEENIFTNYKEISELATEYLKLKCKVYICFDGFIQPGKVSDP
jgi:hypothetical protein